MNDLEKNKLDDLIKSLGEQELRYLNRMVVERIKLINQARSTVAMSNFRSETGYSILSIMEVLLAEQFLK